MTNPQQNKVQNEIKQFKRDINILPDKLKQLKNGLKRIAKMKNRLEQTTKINNEKKKIEKKINLLQDRVDQFKKRQSLLEKTLEQIAKMQNLSQNE